MPIRLACAVAAVASLTAGCPLAPSEDMAQGDVPTVADYFAEEREYLFTALSAAYKRGPHADEKWDAAALAAIEMVVQHVTFDPRRPDANALLEEASKSINLGCRDPVVIHAAALSRSLSRDWLYAVHYAGLALQEYERASYPPEAKALTALLAIKSLADWRRRDRIAEFAPIAADGLVESVKQRLATGADLRLLNTALCDGMHEFPRETAESVVRRLQEIDGVPPALLLTSMGRMDSRKAWDARGTGWAGEVTETGWDGFHANMRSAATHFRAAHAAQPDWPDAASSMVATVTSSGPQGDLWHWVERSTGAVVDWPWTYSRVRAALRPRWGGSFGEMLEFGRKCVRTGRFDTLIPFVFLEVLDDMVADTGGFEVLRAASVYDEAVAVLDALAKHPSQAARKDELLTRKVILGWAFEQHADALDSIEALSAGTLDPGILGSYGMLTERTIRNDTVLFGGDLKERALSARRKEERRMWTEAISEYEQLLAESESEEVARALRDRIPIASIQRDLDEGKSATLTFDDDLSGWRLLEGDVSGRAGELKFLPRDRPALLRTEFGMGTRWELALTIDLSASADTGRFSRANIRINANRQPAGAVSNMVSIFPNNGEVRISHPTSDVTRLEFPTPQDRIYRMLLTQWDNDLLLVINDAVVFSGTLAQHSWIEAGDRLELGCDAFHHGHQFTIGDIQIRRLKAKPEAFQR